MEHHTTSRFRDIWKRWSLLELALIALPFLVLLSSLSGWLTHGIDLPSLDDWRDIESGDAGRFGPSYLFESANDTAYPVGKALDSLAVRTLSGNAVAYQFLSMLGVLGALLMLQFALLRSSTSNTSLAAGAFALTGLAMQPGTYWGGANLAYHQAVPVVCVLAILYAALVDDWRPRFTLPVIFGAAFISGFIYISGAFANGVLFALALIAAFVWKGELRRRMVSVSAALALPTITSLILQIRVILVVQGGSRHDTGFALPWEANFWLYSFGKVARSLYLPIGHLTLSLALTGIVLVILGVVLGISIKRLTRSQSDVSVSAIRPYAIVVALFFVLASYLMMVAVGRANLTDLTNESSLDVFARGFARFHFFWLTLIWPWVFLVIAERIGKPHSDSNLEPDPNGSDTKLRWLPRQSVSILAAVVVVLAYFVWAGLFDHAQNFRAVAGQRVAQRACIVDDRTGSDTPACDAFGFHPSEQAITYAESRGYSFVRTLPRASVSNSGTGLEFREIEVFDAEKIASEMSLINGTGEVINKSNGSSVFRVTPENDTQIWFETSSNVNLTRCSEIAVDVTLKPQSKSVPGDVAQFFYLPTGSAENAFARDTSLFVSRDSWQGPTELRFVAKSNVGFENNFRIDITTGLEVFEVETVGLACGRDR